VLLWSNKVIYIRPLICKGTLFLRVLPLWTMKIKRSSRLRKWKLSVRMRMAVLLLLLLLLLLSSFQRLLDSPCFWVFLTLTLMMWWNHPKSLLLAQEMIIFNVLLKTVIVAALEISFSINVSAVILAWLIFLSSFGFFWCLSRMRGWCWGSLCVFTRFRRWFVRWKWRR